MTIVLAGIREHVCYGNATVTGTEDTVCLAQGYLYLFGTMIVIVSAFCQCLDLYLRVVLKAGKSTLRWVRKLYGGLVAFMIVFPTVVVASTNTIGYEVSLLFRLIFARETHVACADGRFAILLVQSSLSIPSCWIMSGEKDWVVWLVYNVPSTIGHGSIILMMAHCIISMNAVSCFVLFRL